MIAAAPNDSSPVAASSPSSIVTKSSAKDSNSMAAADSGVAARIETDDDAINRAGDALPDGADAGELLRCCEMTADRKATMPLECSLWLPTASLGLIVVAAAPLCVESNRKGDTRPSKRDGEDDAASVGVAIGAELMGVFDEFAPAMRSMMSDADGDEDDDGGECADGEASAAAVAAAEAKAAAEADAAEEATTHATVAEAGCDSSVRDVTTASGVFLIGSGGRSGNALRIDGADDD